jgi:hypothetical protein
VLVKEMGGMNPHPYILCITEESAKRFRDMGMTPIMTDATYFIENLKKHMVARGVLLDESRFKAVWETCDEILQKHAALSDLDSNIAPAMVYTAMYQDGLHNTLRHVLASKSTGTFYNPALVSQLMHMVNESIDEMESMGRYEDVAYLKGKCDAFFFVVADDETRKVYPRYFVFGVEDAILTQNAFIEDAHRAAQLHPKAYERAVKIMADNDGDYLSIHHSPHLYC